MNRDIVIADTSGLLAALNRNDPAHTDARKALDAASYVVVSPLVLTELDHLLRRNVKRAAPAGTAPAVLRRMVGEVTREALGWVVAQAGTGRFGLPETGRETLQTAHAVMARYADRALDLADAVNVALALEFQTDCLLSLDERDFRAMRPLTAHVAFRLLPADG